MNQTPTNSKFPGSAARFRASQLIDCNITNARDESLGDVQDLVLSTDNRSIAYVVVAFGGFFGMGEKFFAMPWRMIKASRSSADAQPRITLAVDQEVLKAAPGFDKNEWPDMADMTWSRQVDAFYSTRGITSEGSTRSNTSGATVVGDVRGVSRGRDPNSKAFNYRRVSQLLGLDVVDGNGETAAKIDDFVLDADRAQIEGAALSFGGVMGMGKHIVLVPVESLSLDRSSGTFTLPCTAADLESLALPSGEWPSLDSDEWLTRGRQQCDSLKKTAGRDVRSATAWDS